MTKEPLNTYRDRLLADVKKYGIRITDIINNTEISRSTVSSFYHKDKRTNRGNLETIDNYIQIHFRDNDVEGQPTVTVDNIIMTERQLLRCFFDNYEKLSKYPEFSIYESNLKKTGVIENQGVKKDHSKAHLSQA